MAKFGIIIIEAVDKKSGSIIKRETVTTLECPTLKAAQELYVKPWYAQAAKALCEHYDGVISDGYALASVRADIRISARYQGTVTAVGVSKDEGNAIAKAAKAKAKHDKRKAFQAAKAKAKKQGNAKAKAQANNIDTSVRVSHIADNAA